MLFPMFVNLSGRPALIVGSGRPAAAKADLLRRTGAKVTVIANEPIEDLRRMAEAGEIILAAGTFADHDVLGKAVVIVASDEPSVVNPVVDAAQRAHIPVNVVDAPERSNFVMPAIIDRDPVVVAVSTGGAAPVLARSVRAKIEALLPANLGVLARFADEFRSAVRSIYPDFAARRHFWERFFASPTAAKVLAGEDAKAREQMLAEVNQARAGQPPKSLVRIVFTDFQAPDLLTLRGLQALQEADVIVYDTAGEAVVRRYARRDADMIGVAESGTPARRDTYYTEAMVGRFVRNGSRLVWLKDVKTRNASDFEEQIRALVRSGVAFEIVPGAMSDPDAATTTFLRAAG